MKITWGESSPRYIIWNYNIYFKFCVCGFIFLQFDIKWWNHKIMYSHKIRNLRWGKRLYKKTNDNYWISLNKQYKQSNILLMFYSMAASCRPVVMGLSKCGPRKARRSPPFTATPSVPTTPHSSSKCPSPPSWMKVSVCSSVFPSFYLRYF